MRAGEQQVFTGIAATTAAFLLKGGRYGMDVCGNFGSGTVTLTKLGADGSTFVPCQNINGSASGFMTAGFQSFALPPGQYKVTINGATSPSLNANLQRIPGE